MTSKKTGYDADDLTTLSGMDAIVKRPGMYIGSTDSKGMTHLAFEIFDNAVDEALAGHCKKIWVTMHDDGSIEIADNGRGIPVDINSKTGKSGVLMAYCEVHSGGKFGGAGYKAAGGLHGVGASVVNALSERVDVLVHRGGKKHEISFRRGKPGTFSGPGPKDDFSPLKDIRETGATKRNGTVVRFWPDYTIFIAGSAIDYDAIVARARQTAFLVPGVEIEIRDKRIPGAATVETFHFTGGIKDMVSFLAQDKPICDPLYFTGSGTYVETVPVLDGKGQMTPQEVERTVEVHVAMAWGTGYESNIQSFANVVRTPNGGTHLKGFERGLVNTLRKGYEGTRILRANEEPPTLDDAKEGLTAVISIGAPEVQFLGQTKDELATPGVQKIVQDIVTQGLKAWIEGKKKAQARTVLEKVANAARARIASRTQREAHRRKTALEGASMPAKLVDCRAIGVDRSELFLVEGDSALGCFTGDTLVATAEGNALTFEQLVTDWAEGIVHYGYATNKAGDVNIAPLIEPRMTKKGARLVRVTLDNGDSVRCTPDHLFRLRDGSYRRADALQIGDSLMPLYRNFSSKKNGDNLNGYERVWMNTRETWVYTHYLADAFNLRHGWDTKEDGNVRHHVDFNRLNSSPSNIKRMTVEGHFQLHAEALDLDKLMAAYRKYLDEGGRELASTRMQEQWKDEEFRSLCSRLSKERHLDPAFREAIQGGFRRWYESLSEQELEEYADRMRALQAQYWASPEARLAAAERTRAYFCDPSKREEWSRRAIEQWNDEELRAWRSSKTTEFFEDPAERERQSLAVKQWRENNPEWVAEHRRLTSARLRDAKNGDLKRMQDGIARYIATTPKSERVARQFAGKMRGALSSIRPFLDKSNEELIVAYEKERLAQRSTRLRFQRILDHFDGDMTRLRDAAASLNHSVANVEVIAERADVYDLTVEGYHNFALEAGVFVHNSARAARNSEHQALLPLRGKILNVQRASLADMLKNAECASIIQVIGAGSGRSFDLEQMRYGRVMLMSVPADETVLVTDEEGQLRLTEIGPFVDSYLAEGIHVPSASTMAFDQDGMRAALAPLKQVIRHRYQGEEFTFSTSYGRQIRVTDSHSVFTWEDGQVALRLASELKVGDVLIAPRVLPKVTRPVVEIDVLRLLREAGATKGVYVSGESLEITHTAPAVLDSLSEAQVAMLGRDVRLFVKGSENIAVDRFVPVSESLCELLGWYTAEGSMSKGQVKFALGADDDPYIPHIQNIISEVTGQSARVYFSEERPNSRQLYFFDGVWANIFRALGATGLAHDKRMPDLMLNVDEPCKFAYLRGLYLGDGTKPRKKISGNLAVTVTSSRALANGVSYLLMSLGVISSVQENDQREIAIQRDLPIKPKHVSYKVGVSGRNQIRMIRSVWHASSRAKVIYDYLAEERHGSPKEIRIGDALIGLPITRVDKRVVDEDVYDFSVADMESFVAGFGGGIMAHNSDADVDGSHIRCLLITLFAKYMRPIIEEGRLYATMPPLHKIEVAGRGGETIYTYTQAEMEATVARLEKAGKKVKQPIQRYKGLGEMNADALWDTTMNPETRTVRRITMDDIEGAERMLELLMGSSIEPRRDWLIENADKVSDLDV